jgi:hypothetical protein
MGGWEQDKLQAVTPWAVETNGQECVVARAKA